MFASFVVEHLNDLGIVDIVSVHDCWVVGADAEDALYRAVEAAGEPWLRRLGPVYDALENYLVSPDPDPTYGPLVQQWRAQWERRVARGSDWPRFRVDKEKLWGPEVFDPFIEQGGGQNGG